MLKNILISVVSSIIVVVVAFFGFSQNPQTENVETNFAGVTGLAGLNVTKDGLKVGTTTQTFKRFSGGICYIAPYAATIAASTTANVDCQGTLAWNAAGSRSTTVLGGVKNNEAVLAILSTTTAGTTFGGLDIVGSSASSTTGFIVLRIANRTGGTFTWPITTGVASGTANYWSPSTGN